MLILTRADVKPCRIQQGTVEQLGVYYRNQLFRYVGRFPKAEADVAVKVCREYLERNEVAILVFTEQWASVWLLHYVPVQQRIALPKLQLDDLVTSFGDQPEVTATPELPERFKEYLRRHSSTTGQNQVGLPVTETDALLNHSQRVAASIQRQLQPERLQHGLNHDYRVKVAAERNSQEAILAS